MKVSPLLSGFSTAYNNLCYLRRGIRMAYGYMWKTLPQVPMHLYRLMISVSDSAKNCLARMFANSKKGDKELEILKLKWKNWKKNPTQKGTQKNGEKLNQINTAQNVEASKDSNPSQAPKSQSFKPEDDPLKGMGAMPDLLYGKMPGLQGNLSEGLKEVDKAIFEEAEGIVKSAFNLLQEINGKKIETWEEYLIALEQIELKLTDLTNNTFKILPKANSLIQSALKSLQDKFGELEEKMCQKVQAKFKPNPKIYNKGGCLFESIGESLYALNKDTHKKKHKPQYYRELAAEYILEHPAEFKSGVLDEMKKEDIKDFLISYAIKQGGNVWKGKMEKELGKEIGNELTKYELYCLGLKDPKMWAGVNEINALSAKLKVSILVFTGLNKEDEKWKFVLKKGSYQKDHPPILLYYYGRHYQNLIPK